MGRFSTVVLLLLAACGDNLDDGGGLDPAQVEGLDQIEGRGVGTTAPRYVPQVCGSQTWTTNINGEPMNVSVAMNGQASVVLATPEKGGQLTGFVVDPGAHVMTNDKLDIAGTFTSVTATVIGNRVAATSIADSTILLHTLDYDLANAQYVTKLAGRHLAEPALFAAGGEELVMPVGGDDGVWLHRFADSFEPISETHLLETAPVTALTAAVAGSNMLTAWSTDNDCYVMASNMFTAGTTARLDMTCGEPRLAVNGGGQGVVVFETSAGANMMTLSPSQFGGNVSGPISRDNLFFFANYEGVRQTRGIFFRTLVPTAAFRATFVPSIRPILDTMPLPTAPFITDGGMPDPNRGIYEVTRDSDLREDTGSVKIDWLQSDNSQFSVRYNINDSKTEVPYGVASDQIAPGTLTVQLFKASHNYTFSPTAVNEFAFGINHNKTNPSAGPSTLPRFDLSFVDGALAVPGPAQFNQFRTGAVYHFLDTFTFIHGDHSMRAGVDIRLNRRSAESLQQDSLIFFGLMDLANNAPFVISRNGHPELDYANENFSFFFQDDWKAHPRLSLNLGLRYDVSTVSREAEGRLQNFDVNTLTITPQGEQLHDMDTNNLGPRVGFAFDVFGNQKTVLRGGYGIFYNRELPASFGSPHANTFHPISVNVFQWFFCGTGGPTFQFPVDDRIFTCGVPAAFHIEKDLQTAMAQHWSLNVQQDIGIGTLQVGYVGNHVSHLLTDGVISPRNINRANSLGTRPLSDNFGDIFVVGGYPESNYNGMQVNFRRNLSKGFRFNANYTWSHAIDNVAGFFKDYQDPNNIANDRASSDQDVRHNFTLDAGYELNLRRWFDNGPRWLLDGWNINAIAQARSGLPVNVTVSGGVFGGFSFRPNLVPGVDPYAPNTARCPGRSLPACQFNPDAFENAGPDTFGNFGRNVLRGPNFAQLDLSIGKLTRITETTSLQLRMEIFNLTDRVNFADPSGGLICTDSNTFNPCAFFGQSNATVGNQLGGLLGFGGPRQIQLSARFNF